MPGLPVYSLDARFLLRAWQPPQAPVAESRDCTFSGNFLSLETGSPRGEKGSLVHRRSSGPGVP